MAAAKARKEAAKSHMNLTTESQHDGTTISRHEFVLVLDKSSMNVDKRDVQGLNPFQMEVPGIQGFKPMHEGQAVHIPPNAAPGQFV